MIGQTLATVFIVWFFAGLTLILAGRFINNHTIYITDIDDLGYWLLGLLLAVVEICIFVGLIILIWKV